MRALVALLLVVAAGCFAAAATAAAEHAEITSCGTVVGAKWVFPGTGGKLSGNKYGVTANGVSCAVAKKYAVKLSGTKLPGKKTGANYPLAGGPKGYTCHGNPDANGKLIAGSCKLGTNYFLWSGRP
jgi:hypothetical protein